MTRFMPPQAHVREGAIVILSAAAARWLVDQAGVGRVFAARGREADRAVASEIVALISVAASASASATSANGSETDTAEPTSSGLTTEQAARRRGVTARAIRAACKSGQLPARRHGRGWQIEPHDLDTYDAGRRTA